jgi:hypothetical protein
MSILQELFDQPQFSIPQPQKEALLLQELLALTDRHRVACAEYRRITDIFGDVSANNIADLPYVPVSLFKTHSLQSVQEDKVFKVITSSGTTGQAVSRIALDRTTADLQNRALTAIMTMVLGSQRLPMIIIDTKNVIKERSSFSARGAGVLGMLPFGRHHFFALDDNMALDVPGLKRFLNENGGNPILLFGFTFMVWKYFYQAILAAGLEPDLSRGILVHSGGWKKLIDERVGNEEFKAALTGRCGIQKIHNFYGMAEQVGSVFLEGDDGFLYPSNFSDVIIRDPHSWEPVAHGTPGVVEVLSVLPRSYPGHALLTEDIGVTHGESDSSHRWKGKRLEITGRVPRSELRGCSDTHAAMGTGGSSQ